MNYEVTFYRRKKTVKIKLWIDANNEAEAKGKLKKNANSKHVINSGGMAIRELGKTKLNNLFALRFRREIQF